MGVKMPDIGMSDFSAGIQFIKAEAAEQLENVIDTTSRLSEFVADQKLAMQQGDQLEKVRAATDPVKRLEKPAKAAPTKKAKQVEKVLSTEKDSFEKELENRSKQFTEKYPVLKQYTLKNLYKELKDLGEKPTPEKVQELVQRYYQKGHEAEADHAFEFLLTVATGDLKTAVEEAKAQFGKKFAKEIKQSNEIEKLAYSVQKEVKGEATDFNNLFVDLVAKRSGALANLDELMRRYPNPSDLFKFISASYRAIGNALNNRQEMDRAELGGLAAFAFELHAIRGIFSTFQKLENTRNAQCKQYGTPLPQHINSQLLAISFVDIVKQRHISSTQVMASVSKLVR